MLTALCCRKRKTGEKKKDKIFEISVGRWLALSVGLKFWRTLR